MYSGEGMREPQEIKQKPRTAEELALHLGLKRLGKNEIASAQEEEELPRKVLLTERELVAVFLLLEYSCITMLCSFLL